MKKIAVIYNKPEIHDDKDISPEDRDTVVGALKIYQELLAKGYEAEALMIGDDEIKEKIAEISKETTIFNYCEWTGQYSQLLIDMTKIFADENRIYTGCSWKDFEWTMEKHLGKIALKKIGTPLLKSAIYENGKLINGDDLHFSAIVKTSKEHCSIGLAEDSVVENLEAALKKAEFLYKKYRQPILIEEFAEGNEYQAFVFETSKGLVTLPVYETIYKKTDNPVLITFEDNWMEKDISDKVLYIGPIKDKIKEKKILDLATDIFTKMKMRGYVRVDFREKNGEVYVLEVNTNPAISWTDNMDFIRVCGEAAGMNFQGLIDLILDGARKGV